LAAAARRLKRRAGGPIDVAVIAGSGLSEGIVSRFDGLEIDYERLHAPEPEAPGHRGVAYAGAWAGKRVVAFAGRVHLYQGCSPFEVTYLVRLAAACGAGTIVLTNAAGAVDPSFARGDVMLIADQINLTGATPLPFVSNSSFVDMAGAYAPQLRELARSASTDIALREGVYAGVRGPQFETPAEVEALRRLGAHAVGMSTVLETIAARGFGLRVLGISLITNAAGAAEGIAPGEVLTAANAGSENVARIIEGVLAAL
jgi:purine-nucleoside phosphorylase